METPWGPSQNSTTIAPGVYWVSTASHGGLLVAAQAASGFFDEGDRKGLTGPAIMEGHSFGAYLAYEEDCKYAIVFYERPDWYRTMLRKNLAGWQQVVDRTQPYWCSDALRTEAPGEVDRLARIIALADEALIAETKLFETISSWDPQYLLAGASSPMRRSTPRTCATSKEMADWQAEVRTRNAELERKEGAAMQRR